MTHVTWISFNLLEKWLKLACGHQLTKNNRFTSRHRDDTRYNMILLISFWWNIFLTGSRCSSTGSCLSEYIDSSWSRQFYLEKKSEGQNRGNFPLWMFPRTDCICVRLQENLEIGIFDHVIFPNCGKVWVNRIDGMRITPADFICILINSFNVKSPVLSAEFENSKT